MAESAQAARASGPGADPRSAAVAFITTEHFTLQGARASTVAESTGRATMFLGAVSAGLVALGLMATATQVGRAFYAFGLILLPTLSFIGLVTFERVLQSGLEDLGYARRIAQLRAYYFDNAPELGPYLYSVPPPQRLVIQGLPGGGFQRFRTVAGMVAVITSVLAGSTAGLLAAVSSNQSLLIGLVVGGAVGTAALVAMMRYQHSAWQQVAAAPFSASGEP
jgi:hypothetical protein